MKFALITGATAAAVVLVLVVLATRGESESDAAPMNDAQLEAVSPGESTGSARVLVELDLDAVDGEAAEFVAQLPRCSSLVQAVELAAAGECMEAAYAGLDAAAVVALAAITELGARADTTCAVVLQSYVRRLSRFHGWAAATTIAGGNRRFGQFNELAVQASRQTARFEHARARVEDCATAGE